ncbi:MAG: hypothetical protein ABEN55_05360 [Bradymonadaceae bacterium]
MRHRAAIASLLAVFAIHLPAAAGQEGRRCPTAPRPSATSRSAPVRAVISALVPTVYLKLKSTRLRQRDRRAGLSPPDQQTPDRGKWRIETNRDQRWEIGLLWNPVRLLRRTRDARRLRKTYRDRTRPRRQWICPALTGGAPDSSSSFEERLERAVARQKRRSLENLLD